LACSRPCTDWVQLNLQVYSVQFSSRSVDIWENGDRKTYNCFRLTTEDDHVMGHGRRPSHVDLLLSCRPKVAGSAPCSISNNFPTPSSTAFQSRSTFLSPPRKQTIPCKLAHNIFLSVSICLDTIVISICCWHTSSHADLFKVHFSISRLRYHNSSDVICEHDDYVPNLYYVTSGWRTSVPFAFSNSWDGHTRVRVSPTILNPK